MVCANVQHVEGVALLIASAQDGLTVMSDAEFVLALDEWSASKHIRTSKTYVTCHIWKLFSLSARALLSEPMLEPQILIELLEAIAEALEMFAYVYYTCLCLLLQELLI